MAMTYALGVAVLAVCVAGCSTGAQVGGGRPEAGGRGLSRVTHLDIASRRPAFGGQSFGAVGVYEILIGRARAVIDPASPLNAGIVDLDKAPRTGAGLVEYSFDVHILKPVDVTKGNRVLSYEFNNRGNRIVYGYFNEGGAGYEAANVGNAFLMNNGYTVVSSGWQGGGASGTTPPPLFAELPIASDGGRPIIGTAREEWIRDTARAPVRRLSYPAATLDQSQATLTVRVHEGDVRRVVPASQWSYADETTINIDEPPGTDAGSIYELIYRSKNPIVMGIGFAAMRDLVTFLRYSAADDAGVANPLFVNGRPAISVAVSTGASQSGRLQRDFIYLGFNEDHGGRRVFEGMNPIVGGGRKTFVNYRFAQPGRFTRQHEDHMFPMDEFPFTYGTTRDALTGKTDGLFRRCAASKTCPKVIQLDADSESYQGHGSLVLTDTTGRDLQLPPEVRYYYLTTAHNQGDAGCRDAANAVSPWPYYRAAYDALVRWVRDGVEPPPTTAPSVAAGTFVTVAEQSRQYPTIPGKPYNARINELGPRDFSVFPPAESAVKYPHFVPRLDRDGNPVAGIIVPEIAAPLATLSGKAVRGKGFAEGDLCGTNGSTLPFAKTKAERIAGGDSRLSLEERYPGGHRDYVDAYRRAVEKLVADRFLLAEDGAKLTKEASRPKSD